MSEAARKRYEAPRVATGVRAELLIKLSGMWKHPTASGGEMLTGNLGQGRLLLLPIAPERRTPNGPDYVLYLAEMGGDKPRD